MQKLEAKHWALIAGFVAATATVLTGLDHWADLLRPAIVGGLLGQLAMVIGSLYAGAPGTGSDPK